jgi:hypothetical protein
MTITKNEFRDTFLRARALAAENAEARLARPIPHSYGIELHAPGSSAQLMTADEALDRIYLGSDRCYRVIDLAVKGLRPSRSVVFARVSGQSPVGYDKTWDPSDLGPFKQVIAEKIENIGVEAS